MTITILPALDSNYIYIRESGPAIAIVDPGEAGPVSAWVRRTGKIPTHILLTHHHSDHIGGADDLRQRYGARLIGAAADAHRLPKLDQAVSPSEVLEIGTDCVRIIAVPGHTLGHVAYWFENTGQAFVGDALFSLGCGRVFEGTPAMMLASLEAIAALPPETELYCGHEYTAANARFALTVEPANHAIQQVAGKPLPTMPTTVREERAANPFLRCAEPAIAAALGLPGGSPVEVFAELRHRKDHFK